MGKIWNAVKQTGMAAALVLSMTAEPESTSYENQISSSHSAVQAQQPYHRARRVRGNIAYPPRIFIPPITFPICAPAPLFLSYPTPYPYYYPSNFVYFSYVSAPAEPAPIINITNHTFNIYKFTPDRLVEEKPKPGAPPSVAVTPQPDSEKEKLRERIRELEKKVAEQPKEVIQYVPKEVFVDEVLVPYNLTICGGQFKYEAHKLFAAWTNMYAKLVEKPETPPYTIFSKHPFAVDLHTRTWGDRTIKQEINTTYKGSDVDGFIESSYQRLKNALTKTDPRNFKPEVLDEAKKRVKIRKGFFDCKHSRRR